MCAGNVVSREVRFSDEPTQVRALDAAWVQIGSQTIHYTHQPCAKRGIFWCAVCGAYGGARPQHLARPCREVPTPRGRDVLSRLQRGLTPQSNVPWPRAPGQSDDMIDLTRETRAIGNRGRDVKVGCRTRPVVNENESASQKMKRNQHNQYLSMTMYEPQNP